MPKQDAKQELFTIISNNELSCVDRGKAIKELLDLGMRQVDVARSTGLHKVSISHLKKRYDNLRGKAREMCELGRMNADACHLLVNAPDSEQEIIFQRAIVICKMRDSKRSEQNVSPKGRQSPKGQITYKDIKQAIKDTEEAK